MDDSLNLEPLTTAEILDGFGVDVENFYVVIDDDDALDDDQRAELIKKFEQIEELVNEAKKIVGVSSEND